MKTKPKRKRNALFLSLSLFHHPDSFATVKSWTMQAEEKRDPSLGEVGNTGRRALSLSR